MNKPEQNQKQNQKIYFDNPNKKPFEIKRAIKPMNR